MSIDVGTRLGSLEITALLGKGGMGEVYRARDLKLKREVAIKILPEGFSRDTDRLSRFQREAEVLASLNHPNIAAIHDLEETNGTRYLVLELVEGETLADRIARGSIPVEEALAIAKQLCEALEAAHERGIIHRDLKPANIKLTPDGKVKVLDFGLAKAMETEAASLANLSNSPTIISGASMPGIILGTAPYMSPEQAKGRPVDKRTDIFAFGCVLYEMLTGKPTFEGDDVSQIIAHVLARDPDWERLPATIPSRIRELLHLCLEKNVKNRQSDATDVRLHIALALKELDAPAAEIAPPKSSRRREYFWAAAAFAFLLTTAGLAIRSALAPAPEAHAVRFDVFPPEGATLLVGAQYSLLSPDGRMVAFVATSGGKSLIWVRLLDSPAAQPLAGTDGAHAIFWSGDSRDIGFFAQGKVKRIPATGGLVQVICNETDREAAWSTQGVVLIGGQQGKPLLRVTAAGGEPTPVTELDKSRNEISHDYPDFLPDGRHFLYMARAITPDHGQDLQVYVGSLDSKERRLIPGIKTSAKYSVGYVLFGRDNRLMAQRFDAGRLEVSGEPFPITEMPSPPRPLFSLSTTGAVGYLPSGRSRGDSQLAWFDRTGKQTASVGSKGQHLFAQLSLDGKHIAFQQRAADLDDIWVMDVQKGIASRLTPGPASPPVWSPDGNAIVFASIRGGVAGLYERNVGVVGEDKLLLKGQMRVTDWSRDGKYIAYLAGGDIWALPIAGERQPLRVTQTAFSKTNARISPDGNWVAYESNETGQRSEIYVQSFPKPGAKQQVSAAGGSMPRWSMDGKELFFLTQDFTLMVVSLKRAGPSLEIGPANPLFETGLDRGAYYSVSTDGRFLMEDPKVDPFWNRIAIILNWQALGRKEKQ
jgi:Tol biopolymer transport system component